MMLNAIIEIRLLNRNENLKVKNGRTKQRIS